MLLFVISFSYGEISQLDRNQALFKAIEQCDFRAVQAACYKGVSINVVDEATGDTPLFFATKKLLKTILEAHDDCYINSIPPQGRWLTELRYAIVSIAAILGGVALGATISKRYSKPPIGDADFIIFPLAFGASIFTAAQLNVSIDNYFRNKKSEVIPSLVAIINLLAMSYGWDKTYKHPKRDTDIKKFLSDIINAKPSGKLELVRNFEFFGKFIDYSYKFVLDSDETVYCSQEAYLKHVKPIFEKLKL